MSEAYKEHRAGSPKGVVHKVFDEKGKDAAIKKATSLGLQESTARTWCSTWGKGGKKKATPKDAKAKSKSAGKSAKKASASKAKPANKKKSSDAPIKRETLASASA